MRVTMVPVLAVLATLVAGSAVGEERFRLVPTERPTPRSCIEVEMRGEDKVVAFYDEHGTIVKEITLEFPCSYPVVSKNKQNVVIREPVGECDILAHYRLHLYDAKGALVATSEPLMLYDLSVEPMGNDSTVLVIYPAVEVPVFSITFLQARGGALGAAVQETGGSAGPVVDVAGSGGFFVVSDAPPSDSRNAEVRLVRADGTTAWTTRLDEVETAPGLTISPLGKYIVVASADYEKRRRYANLLTADGCLVGKTAVEWEGKLKAVFPADGEESHVLILSGGELRFCDTPALQPVRSLRESAHFVSAVLRPNGYVFATTSEWLVIMDKAGLAQKIRLPSGGAPSLHQVRDTTYVAVASTGSIHWLRLEEGRE